jgi:hypothetical protein
MINHYIAINIIGTGLGLQKIYHTQQLMEHNIPPYSNVSEYIKIVIYPPSLYFILSYSIVFFYIL